MPLGPPRSDARNSSSSQHPTSINVLHLELETKSSGLPPVPRMLRIRVMEET